MKDLRRRAALVGAREQAVGDVRVGIGLRSVGERKEIDREEDVEVLQRVARRLTEAVIERAASGAADLIEDAVEHLAPPLVGVESLIQEMPEETSALRTTPRERVANAGRRIVGGGVVLEEADQIACPRQADADDFR